MEIIIATNNQGKVREFKNRLKEYEVFSLKDKGIDIEVEEDGLTFEENAIKKARAVADLTGTLTMADDSGLEVVALGFAPGIYSARYGGDGLDDTGRYQKLLEEMKEKEDRTARFVSVIALCYPDGRNITLRGECYGNITEEPHGEGGFGYDPVFYYPPLKKTFSEISLEEKNKISHRARALDKLERYFMGLPCHIENEYLSLEVSEKGGEILSLKSKKDGTDLMNTDLKSWDFVAPVLFPVLGRVKDSKYEYDGKVYEIEPHGFTRTSNFKLLNQNENSVSFILTDNEQTKASYPFSFSLEVTYTLCGKELKTEYKVTNKDEQEMFFNIGAHDAYKIGKDYENYSIEFEKEEALHENFLKLDAFENPFIKDTKTFPLYDKDDRCASFFCEKLRSNWVQLNYKGIPKVRVHFELDKTQILGFWNLPGSEFFCIEPWSGIHEACQTETEQTKKQGVLFLKPGEAFTYTHKAQYFLD